MLFQESLGHAGSVFLAGVEYWGDSVEKHSLWRAVCLWGGTFNSFCCGMFVAVSQGLVLM